MEPIKLLVAFIFGVICCLFVFLVRETNPTFICDDNLLWKRLGTKGYYTKTGDTCKKLETESHD